MITINNEIYKELDISNVVIEKNTNGEEKRKYICLVQKLVNEEVKSNLLLEVDTDKLPQDSKERQYIKEYQEYIKWYKELEVGTYIAFLPFKFFAYKSKCKDSFIFRVTPTTQVSIYSWGTYQRYSFITNSSKFFKLQNITNKQQIKNFITALYLAHNIKPLCLVEYEGRYIG